jgi:hypothetical protein
MQARPQDAQSCVEYKHISSIEKRTRSPERVNPALA